MATYNLNESAVREGIAKFPGSRPMVLYQGGAHFQRYGEVEEDIIRDVFENCTRALWKRLKSNKVRLCTFWIFECLLLG